MYSLVSRIPEGLKELKNVLEEHIHNQGVTAIAKSGDAATIVRGLNKNSKIRNFSVILFFFTI